MQKILAQVNNNKEEFQKYLDELFKGDFSLISQLDYSFILKIIFLMDELELFENFKLVSYLSLDNQYKLLKEPLKEKTLIKIIPYLDARVKSFFFKNDKRAYEIFQYFNVSQLAREGVLFSYEIINSSIFFELLKRESLIDFRININNVLRYNPSIFILEKIDKYYDSMIDSYMESTDMFSCYYEYIEEFKKNIKINKKCCDYFFDDYIFYKLEELQEYDFFTGKVSFNNMDKVYQFFSKETGIRLSEIIVDSLFQDNIYNVWLNIKEMLRYHKLLDKEQQILNENIVSFYDMILNIDKLNNSDKIKVYHEYKDKNIGFMFYQDLRNMKNLSYRNIKKELIKLEEYPEFLDEEQTNKYGIPIYDLRDKEYIMLSRCLMKFSDTTIYPRSCYTLFSNENCEFFNNNLYIYGYYDFDYNKIVHVFENDSHSNDYINKNNEIGSDKVNRIMSPLQIVNNGIYSEIQLMNSKIFGDDNLFKNLKPNFLIVVNNVSEENILEARRLDIPIAIIKNVNLLENIDEYVSYEEIEDDYIVEHNFNELVKRRKRI